MSSPDLLIQAQIRQDCVGKDQKRSPWERLLPLLGNPNKEDVDRLFYIMPSGSLLSETFQGKSLSKQKFQKREVYFDSRQKLGLRRILTRDIGLGRKVSDDLVSRSVVHFRRIEEFISGFVDSLWLADEKVFRFKSPESLLIRKLIRKIFSVGTYNLCSLVDQWKEWGNFLFHTLAETHTIGELKKPAANNIFRRLNGLSYINSVYRGEKSMLLMQHVSHLISSRQMPYMGKSTEKRARDKFQKVLTSDGKTDESLIFQLKLSARRIGGICKHIRSRRIPDGVAHISVTSSGEAQHPIAKGAQVAAVKEAMERILSRIPCQDEEENTPFGPVRHQKGIPIWRTLFREETLDSRLGPGKDYMPQERECNLFDPYNLIKDQTGRFAGLDEYTGRQILYVAWKEISLLPVLRAEVVPEMGNKARFVTLSDYWLNVLQAPLSHVLIDAMKFHPSVFSSFHRQDQAFEAVKGLAKLKAKALRDGEYVLSSDLQDATNAQRWDVTIAILTGFMQGFGIQINAYTELVLSLIGPRLILLDDDTSVLSKVGIMMGEAIAKPSLTLLNLSIEELSFLKSINSMETLSTVDPAPYRDWRYCHIGGDDHLIRGPSHYLDLITQIHLDVGSQIDHGKHGFSKICVRYTERLINLTNLDNGKPFDLEDYSRSMIVDSVKVRLLERGLSTLMKKDNKNVAIGKSTQLGGCLEWLPIDSRFFTESKKESIRALFVERMGPLLPRKAVNPRAFAAIHLPNKIGGYGLGMKRELKYFLMQSPEPFGALVSKASLGFNVKCHLRYFRWLNSNVSTRGVASIDELQAQITDQLSEYPEMINAIDWKELKSRFPSDNAKRTIALAADEGILSIEEFSKRATRGNLFQKLFMESKDLKVFNTRPFVHTCKQVWDKCEDDGLLEYGMPDHLTNEEITTVISEIGPQYFFDTNQESTVDVGYLDDNPDNETFDFQSSTYNNMYNRGLPSLEVGIKFLGLL